MSDAVHHDPVWRDRSNFIIGIGLEPSDSGVDSEQLWARRLDAKLFLFELCCIPFFVYDLALGDVVRTDDSFNVLAVVKPSGRFVFRVWFGYADDPPVRQVFEGLKELGAVLEWSSENLLAVDAVDRRHARAISKYLRAQEEQRHLIYETGKR